MLFCIILAAMAPLILAKPFDGEEVMTMLEKLQEKVDKLEKENEMQDLTIDALQVMTSERFVAVEKNLEAINPATVDTLFLATIAAETVAISDDEPIIFDTAPINPGGHYNTVLGAYTSPYTGYYQFSVAKRSNDGRANFWLLIDEDRYLYFDVNIFDGGSAPTGTTTINIQLTAGQIVRVENNISTLMYGTDSAGTISSYFTGYMLYLL